MIHKWLVISYFANVDALAASHHIDDRLPFLKQREIDIYLLSSPCGINNKNLSHTRIPSLGPSGIRYEVRYPLRRKINKKFWYKFCQVLLLLPVYPFYFIEKMFFRLDSTWSWSITAAVAAIILSIKNRPEVIYSTGGPVSAHIAAMIASYITKIPHIAEIQDPLGDQYAAPGKFERYFMKKVEGLILKTADVSVFLTQQAAANASLRNPESKKIAALYAGAVPQKNALFYRRGETFNIAHFGSLAGSRNLNYFFKGMYILFEECPDLLDCFRLSLYGKNGRDVKKQLEQFKYKEILQIYGKVERQKAVELMYKVDVLLLVQQTDGGSFETIPSKVYEYLHTGRPILALVYRNYELQSMLEGMGHVVVQADDEAAIKRGIEIYITRWKQDQLQCSVLKSPHTVARAVDEFISFVGDIGNAKKC